MTPEIAMRERIDRLIRDTVDDYRQPPTVTEYAIRLTCGLWLGDRDQWHEESKHAVKFASMTIALVFACEWLELDPLTFTVEPVEVR